MYFTRKGTEILYDCDKRSDLMTKRSKIIYFSLTTSSFDVNKKRILSSVQPLSERIKCTDKYHPALRKKLIGIILIHEMFAEKAQITLHPHVPF